MPTRDRKYYIKRHNEVTAEENKKNGTMTLGGEMASGVGMFG